MAELTQQQVRTMCGAFGPAHSAHFYCALSASGPPPDTIAAQFISFVRFAVYLGMDTCKAREGGVLPPPSPVDLSFPERGPNQDNQCYAIMLPARKPVFRPGSNIA